MWWDGKVCRKALGNLLLIQLDADRIARRHPVLKILLKFKCHMLKEKLDQWGSDNNQTLM
jgi:hypothetical protein